MINFLKKLVWWPSKAQPRKVQPRRDGKRRLTKKASAPSTKLAKALKPNAVNTKTRKCIDPIEEARQAVETIDDANVKYKYGKPRPSDRRIADAWETLERIDLPLAGYIRAELKLGGRPPTYVSGHEYSWFRDAQELPSANIDRVVKAIWRGVDLKAWPALEDVMARQVEHILRDATTHVEFTNGPRDWTEKHVRDSQNRLIFLRVIEHGPGGVLEIRDEDGGTLSRTTLVRSEWKLEDGWIWSNRRKGRWGGGGQEGGMPPQENTPPLAPKK